MYDVFVNSSRNSILDAINGRHDFTSLNIALEQNPDNGSLMLGPQALRSSLNQFGITDLSMATNGNLKIATPDGRYYSARPDLSSQDSQRYPIRARRHRFQLVK
ncbi:MAG TPA: hypothetical protein EYP59_13665, partial [Thiotrichaceae bacterium]|nr:hypothetical protein [Thiotrichaceae bacterium]